MSVKFCLGLLSALLALYAAGLVFESDFAPRGCCGLTWPLANPFQAERLGMREDQRGTDIAIQQRMAIAVLGATPADMNGWLRLAYIDTLRHGRLTAEGRTALHNSYLTHPYGGSDTPWRIVFAFDHWSELDQAGRAEVIQELKIVDKDERVRGLTRTAGRGISQPAGRVAAVLLGLEPPWTWSRAGAP